MLINKLFPRSIEKAGLQTFHVYHRDASFQIHELSKCWDRVGIISTSICVLNGLKPQVPSFNHPRRYPSKPRCLFSHGPVLHLCLPRSGNADKLAVLSTCFESSFRMISRLLFMTQRSTLCSSTTQVVTRRGPTTGARRATVTYTSVLRIFTAKRHPAAV
jgi:hypothetical protein